MFKFARKSRIYCFITEDFNKYKIPMYIYLEKYNLFYNKEDFQSLDKHGEENKHICISMALMLI